jgi:hypothetical protein
MPVAAESRGRVAGPAVPSACVAALALGRGDGDGPVRLTVVARRVGPGYSGSGDRGARGSAAANGAARRAWSDSTTAVRIFGGVLAQATLSDRRRAAPPRADAECCVLTVTDDSVRQTGKVARPDMLNCTAR